MKYFPAKLLISICLMCAVAAQAAPFMTFDARTLAMGGAGSADGLLYGTYNNPALLPFDVEFLAWQVIPAAGKFKTDEDDFNAGLSGFQSAAADLSAIATIGNANAAAAALQSLDGIKYDSIEVFSINVPVPSSIMGGAIFVNKYVFESVRADVGNIDVSNPASPSYGSTLEKRGVSIVEQGISFAHVYSEDPRDPQLWALGFSPKLVLAQTVVSSNDITTTGTSINFSPSKSSSAFNLDIGALKHLGRYSFAAVIKNLLPMEFDTVTGEKIEFKPQARLGVAYVRRTYSWNVDLDLTSNDGVGFANESQYASAGFEYRLGSLFKLRAGYRQNLKADKDAGLSFGFGVGREYHLDMGFFKSDEEQGVITQFGMQF